MVVSKSALVGLSLCTLSAVLLYFLLRKDEDDAFEEQIHSSQRFKREKAVAKDCIAMIIGKGGCKVREIEERTGAKISFSDNADPDSNCKLIQIRGSQMALELADNLIDEIVEQHKSMKTSALQVPHWAVGKIIGRGGENIHSITQSSGARIKVEGDGSALHKNMRISGTPVQINLAIDAIQTCVEEEKKRRDNARKREPRRKKNSSEQTAPVVTQDLGIQDPRPCPQNAPPAGSSGALLEVFVSAVTSPSRFWMQIVGPQRDELDNLTKTMEEYYNNADNRELHKIADVQVGQIVAAVFRNDGKWYRAKVMEIKPNEFDERQEVCDVNYVDFGDNEYVAKEELCSLRTDMLQLRFQAVECFLDGVAPADEHWSKLAIERFEELTQVARWKRLWSRTCSFRDRPKSSEERNTRESSPIPGVTLFDLVEGNDFNIGQALINEGWAVMVFEDQKPPQLPTSPVLDIKPPTFGDLECSRVLGMVVGNRDDRASSLPHGASPSTSPQPQKRNTNEMNESDKPKSVSLAAGMDHPNEGKVPNPLWHPKPETNGTHAQNGNKTTHEDFLNAERTAKPLHVPDPKDQLKANINRVDSHPGSLEAMGKPPPLSLVHPNSQV